MSGRSLRVKAVAAATAALMATGVAGAPEANAQGGTTTLGGAAIALQFLGGLIFVQFPETQQGGPGYVDIVGQPCGPDCDEAKWTVNLSPFHSVGLPYQFVSTHRVVIPKDGVHRPVIRDASYREDVPAGESREQLVMDAYTAWSKGKTEEEVAAFLQSVSDRYVSEKPDSMFGDMSLVEYEEDPDYMYGYRTTPGGAVRNIASERALDDLGGEGRVYRFETEESLLSYADFSDYIPGTYPLPEENVPFTNPNGDSLRVLTAHRDDAGDLTIYYQPIPAEVRGLVDGSDYSVVGMSTDLDRKVYKVTIPADEITSTNALNGSPVEVDPEGDVSTYYEIMSDALAEAGTPTEYDNKGSLDVDLNGWLHGSMVLPDEAKPIPVRELEEDLFTSNQYGHMLFPREYSDSEDSGLTYSVREVEDNWVLDVYAPPSQVRFEVAAMKDEEAIERGVKYAMAQVHTSNHCSSFEGEERWTCVSLFPPDRPQSGENRDWGTGATGTDQLRSVVTDGVIRGVLEVSGEQEARFDANPYTEPMRGIFGNEFCRVSRPTEDRDNYLAEASTVLPSDMNVSFPGQPENLGIPIVGRPFIYEIEIEGVHTGEPFAYEDACDQAAVPLAVTAAPPTDPTDPTDPTTEPTDPTTSPTDPPTSPTEHTHPPGPTVPTGPTSETTDPATSSTTATTPGTSPAPSTGPGVQTPPPGRPGVTPPPAPGLPGSPVTVVPTSPSGDPEAVSEKTGPVVDTGGTVKPSWWDRLVALL